MWPRITSLVVAAVRQILRARIQHDLTGCRCIQDNKVLQEWTRTCPVRLSTGEHEELQQMLLLVLCELYQTHIGVGYYCHDYKALRSSINSERCGTSIQQNLKITTSMKSHSVRVPTDTSISTLALQCTLFCPYKPTTNLACGILTKTSLCMH